MTRTIPSVLTGPHEGAVAQVTNVNGAAELVLVCEHASSYIPEALDDLGLSREARYSHIAWDIGAFDLALALCRMLDAPLVSSTVSRLVYDCNRPLEDASATPAVSEIHDVPGNRSLTSRQRQQRYDEVYVPFHQLLAQQIDTRVSPGPAQTSAQPAQTSAETVAGTTASPVSGETHQSLWRLPWLVTIHSFTSVYHGINRDVEIGLLHDTDDRLARKMHDTAGRSRASMSQQKKPPAPFRVELNQPYGASDGVLHTLETHASAAELPSVMIEVNNSLIRDADGVESIAAQLYTMIQLAMEEGRQGQML